jgi:hypothetical protein
MEAIEVMATEARKQDLLACISLSVATSPLFITSSLNPHITDSLKYVTYTYDVSLSSSALRLT